MDIETRIDLIKKPPTEEILVEDELKQLLETNEHPQHYQGFEISGLLHLGNFIISGFKINDFIKAGIRCQAYLADWHSFINNKFGGDWEKILIAAKYYAEAFKFFCPGVKIVVGSDLYHNNDEYWKRIMKFSKHMTLKRTLRCMTIMGRSENEKLDLSQYFYPPMQAVDVKEIGADMPHGGMDQRKAHVLAREVFPKMKWKKPVAVHHHLLMGIAEPMKLEAKDKLEQVISSKMSKSKPWTAIFIHDTEEQIKKKLQKAWCPEKQTEMNPILEIIKHVIFHEKKIFEISRDSKFGGTIEFDKYEKLEKSYEKGEIHPKDLKDNVAREISNIIDPLRKHFEKPSNKKLLDVYKEVEITR
ncbi:MAG: tyrosine--tRNA ligase [Candidatus Aenigmarchaeota archaeon]|nr:tyrosine--tRNA ligase [Candidatus Aenigmarchaeota archaeon]